jgi:hypothetical protein
MKRINGHSMPESIKVPEHGNVGNTDLIRAAINVFFLKRGMKPPEWSYFHRQRKGKVTTTTKGKVR